MALRRSAKLVVRADGPKEAKPLVIKTETNGKLNGDVVEDVDKKPSKVEGRKRKFNAAENGAKGPPKKLSYQNAVLEDGKPDWKKLREERKKLKESRKKKELNPEVYKIIKEAKVIWEEMRTESCPENVRSKLCEELYLLISNHVKKFSFAHDTTRILESLLVHGTPKIRTGIHSAFKAKEDFLVLIKSKYGHFLALKLLKYADKSQKIIYFEAVKNQVVNLLRHQFGSLFISELYSTYANVPQKNHIIRSCFGRLMEIENCEPELSKISSPDTKLAALKNVHELMTVMIEKRLTSNVVLLLLMHQFIENCPVPERAEWIAIMREELVKCYLTNEGSLLAMSCVWHGTPKDRKVIIKSFKGLVPKIACNKFGHRILLTLLDSVDDTVLLSKAIFSEIMSDLNTVVMNNFGVRVLSYLFDHRSKLFFDPEILKLLAKGDTNEFTKKPVDQKLQEVAEGLRDPIIYALICDFGMWIKDNKACLLTLLIMQKFSDKSMNTPLQTIAEHVCAIPTAENIERKAVEMLCKVLLKTLPEDNRLIFAKLILKNFKEEWVLCSKGCLTLLRIIECTPDEKMVMLSKKSIIPFLGSLRSSKLHGAELLLKRIEESS